MTSIKHQDSSFIISIPVRKYAHTCGDGYWSKTVKKVFIQKFEFTIEETRDEDGERYCTLDIFFSRSSWVHSRDGLIYTDSLFEKNIRDMLLDIGIPEDLVSHVGYSEQGMQGTTRVNMDAFELGEFVYEKYIDV